MINSPFEHVNYGTKEVTLQWNKEWYKIPFFVLEDLAQEWESMKRGDLQALEKWTSSWHIYTAHDAIRKLKKILEPEIQGLEAYKLYNTE